MASFLEPGKIERIIRDIKWDGETEKRHRLIQYYNTIGKNFAEKTVYFLKFGLIEFVLSG
jgi:hypothetical protein